MNLIQIEGTNSCNHQCANYTQVVDHHKKSFFMDLDIVVKGIESPEGYTVV